MFVRSGLCVLAAQRLPKRLPALKAPQLHTICCSVRVPGASLKALWTGAAVGAWRLTSRLGLSLLCGLSSHRAPAELPFEPHNASS